MDDNERIIIATQLSSTIAELAIYNSEDDEFKDLYDNLLDYYLRIKDTKLNEIFNRFHK